MKARHQKTVQLIFQRPVCGSIRWADIEALFIALGAEITEAEGSRLCVRLFNDRRVFTGHTHRLILTRGRRQASANGWKKME